MITIGSERVILNIRNILHFTVIQVEVRFESVDDITHDTKYYVRVKHTFKSKVVLKKKTHIVVLYNKCKCPELLPRKDYLVMGFLSQSESEDEPQLVLDRQSFVQLWKPLMMKKLKPLKNITCPNKPTRASIPSSPEPGM